MSERASKTTRNLAFIVLVSAAAVAGAYYYFDRIRPDREQMPTRPNPDFTTAPEGGAKVDLPEAPMTNVPLAPPVAERKQPDEAKGEGDNMPLPSGK